MKTNRILTLASLLTCIGLLAPLAHAQDIRYLLADNSGVLIGNSTVPGFEEAIEVLSSA